MEHNSRRAQRTFRPAGLFPLIVLTGAVLFPGLIAVAHAQSQGIADEVMKADEAYRLAKLNRDIPALDQILADGFNETNQNGNSRNKAQSLDLWKTFSVRSLTTDSSQVQISGTTAMVTGKMTENGMEHMLFTRVYVLDGSGWRLLASMQFRDPYAAADTPVHVGPEVQQANLLTKVAPVYPPLAKAARVQGTVSFQAFIGNAGTIERLQLLSGPPLLVQAATEAVRQWTYKPTLVDGKPATVVTTIDIRFELQE